MTDPAPDDHDPKPASPDEAAPARVHLPIVTGVRGSILQNGGRKHLVPADVHGRFATLRKVAFALLIGLWIALPWITVRGAPAVFLDVEARKFFLFGATFNAQDAWMVFFLVSGLGFGLVYATALLGRAWCGWACPQTVFLEGVYRPLERLFEGPRDKHLRRDAGPMTAEKAARKAGKHAAFVVASLLVAHLVLAYFVSLPRAFAMVRGAPTAHLEAFLWVLGVTTLFYVNFGLFREQFCVVMCPYGRLQSVLLDDDSLVVGYDVGRGEPRGKPGKTTGDCVDCKRCVAVCPTGIDIRDGLQLDCVACTACIDACDEVMDKLDRPRGLIRYDSTNGLAGRARRIVRPRVLAYSGLLVLGAIVAFLTTRGRIGFEAAVLRPAGLPYVIEDGTIRNTLDVHLVNKRSEAQTYAITVTPPAGVSAIVPIPRPEVAGLGDAHLPLVLTMPTASYQGDGKAHVTIVSEGNASDTKTITVPFLGAKK